MCLILALAAGAALTIMGQVQQANAQKAQAKYQQGVAQNNAILAERAAVDAEERGQAEAEEVRRRARVVAGQQRAGFGAAGVSLAEGTPTDVLSDTRLFGELDAQTAISNAEREALGYRTQGMNFEADARLNKFRRKQVGAALPLQIGSTLVGSALRAYSFGAFGGGASGSFQGVGGQPY